MTLREKMHQLIYYQYDVTSEEAGKDADAFLQAVKEHLVTDEAVERGCSAYDNVYRAGAFTNEECTRAAILAALGEE